MEGRKLIDMGALKSVLPRKKTSQLLGDAVVAVDERLSMMRCTHMSHAHTDEGLRFALHSDLVAQVKARLSTSASAPPSPPTSAPTSPDRASDARWL
eukprot:COSAG06_NODE_19532_length_834_cov_0.948299_2_plen_97_part_00